MKVFAKKCFREIRIKKGFTTVSLGNAIGTTKQMVGQFEKRLNGVGPDKAKKIIDVLEVEFDDVFELVEREG
jgi:DNA-binding XRE family transcriptional regulator